MMFPHGSFTKVCRSAAGEFSNSYPSTPPCCSSAKNPSGSPSTATAKCGSFGRSDESVPHWSPSVVRCSSSAPTRCQVPDTGKFEGRAFYFGETQRVAVEISGLVDVTHAHTYVIDGELWPLHRPSLSYLVSGSDGSVMEGNHRRASVVGGSLGGLTVANLLRDAGWDVTVHERSRVPLDSRGAGIVLHEATSRYLVERSGISLDSVSCRSSFVRHLHADGTTAYEEPSDYRFTSWNSLYRALLSTIQDDYFLDHAVTSIDEGPDGVVLHLADGSTDHADLVVAADDVDSTVRRQEFNLSLIHI